LDEIKKTATSSASALPLNSKVKGGFVKKYQPPTAHNKVAAKPGNRPPKRAASRIAMGKIKNGE
jgi:hypothetical protein